MAAAPSDLVDVRIIDLWPHLHTPAVAELLQLAAPETATEAIVSDLYEHRSTRDVAGAVVDRQLVGLVTARRPYVGVCEILGLAVEPEWRRQGVARRLIDAAAERLQALAIWADTPPDVAAFWERCGFHVRTVAPRPGVDDAAGHHERLRAERRHPPEPEGFFTAPRVQRPTSRRLEIELPPPGNTLPLVPDALADDIPAFVAAWVVEADEIGLIVQDLAPHLFPPVTPAVRPDSIRSALGSLRSVLGDGPHIDEADAAAPIPELPNGVTVPVRFLEILAGAERLRAWLVTGRRVRAWARERGHDEAVWMVPDPYPPAPLDLDDQL